MLLSLYKNQTVPAVKHPSINTDTIFGKPNTDDGVGLFVINNIADIIKPNQVEKHNGQVKIEYTKSDLPPIQSLNGWNIFPSVTMVVVP